MFEDENDDDLFGATATGGAGVGIARRGKTAKANLSFLEADYEDDEEEGSDNDGLFSKKGKSKETSARNGEANALNNNGGTVSGAGDDDVDGEDEDDENDDEASDEDGSDLDEVISNMDNIGKIGGEESEDDDDTFFLTGGAPSSPSPSTAAAKPVSSAMDALFGGGDVGTVDDGGLGSADARYNLGQILAEEEKPEKPPPSPASAPAPAPAPAPSTASAPEPEPEPASEPASAPEPKPASASAPVLGPASASASEPAPVLGPAAAPEPELVPDSMDVSGKSGNESAAGGGPTPAPNPATVSTLATAAAPTPAAPITTTSTPAVEAEKEDNDCDDTSSGEYETGSSEYETDSEEEQTPPPPRRKPPVDPLLHKVYIKRASSKEMLGFDIKVRVAEASDGIKGIFAYIGAVLAGGLAERSGLRAGDRITRIGFMVLADIIYPDQVMEFLRDNNIELEVRADPARADATKPRVPVQMNEAANPFQEKWIGVDGPIDTSTASAASKPVPIPGSGNGGSGGRGLAIDHVDTFLGAFSSAPTDSPVGSPTRPPPLSAQDLEEGAARAGVSLSDAAASSGLPSPIGTSSLRKVETRQAHYDREIVFDRAAEATKSGKQIEDIKLGFEIGLSQVKGNVVTIKALDTNGLAAQMSGEAKICVGDTVLEVNGTKVEALSAGAAGRIFLFRLLAAPKVTVNTRTIKTVVGYTDTATRKFVTLS